MWPNSKYFHYRYTRPQNLKYTVTAFLLFNFKTVLLDHCDICLDTNAVRVILPVTELAYTKKCSLRRYIIMYKHNFQCTVLNAPE